MTNKLSPKDFPWKTSRYGFAAFFFASLLAGCFVLRLILFIKFGRGTGSSAGTVAQMFLIGFHRDAVAALFATLPLLFWLWIVGDARFEGRFHRLLFLGGFFLFWTVQVFIYCVEFYFFDEFKSRFNTVAVDYLSSPKEVAGNIWDSYPVVLIVGICLLASSLWIVGTFRYFRQMWFQPTYTGTRFLYLVAGSLLCAALWFTLSLQGAHINLPTGLSLKAFRDWFQASVQGIHFSNDRTINQLADNGSLSFINAFLTRNLDYSANYRTIPRDEAYARVRKLLTVPEAEFIGDQYSLRRKITGDLQRPRLNVIILLEESLGSEFWGCLGRKNTLTPNMDRIATEQGLLFTNMYACGNRTVRGFEGVFSSFPPLPGDSIVRRDRSENVESIARILKRDGYSTVFLYGGRGFFDGMRSYALDNGWDRFLEHNPPFHSDFPKMTFATIWGVCDEEVYAQGIEEFRKLHEAGKPFLGTILTVSNHKPYTYPPGRISDDGGKPSRQKAVRYTDWSLGRFFDKVKDQPFWTNTVFVVVADHGARVYGRQDIPIHSYEIPFVVLGPAVVKGPQRIGVLGSSLDVAPTILGLIGRPYESMFFGRDLLHDPPDFARALLNHNRDIGLFEQDRMVVLGLQKAVEFYEGNPKTTELKAPVEVKSEFLELEKNATAIYQVADELYMNRLYRIDGMPSAEALAKASATNSAAQPKPGSLILTNSPPPHH
jgi:phosphoglycerol transferase MdoB-like AlkP superfamily enzyme